MGDETADNAGLASVRDFLAKRFSFVQSPKWYSAGREGNLSLPALFT
jgi:hypothetical protein